ncbi:MAG TPA: ATP-binding protein [Cyclobacteriaceae bacterium]|nr:ATP-binding protein [Cyclobacteriaceae bacterium]
MNLKFKEVQQSLNRFSRLGTLYILALSVVATVVIAGQVLIQLHLRNQLTDSRVVNVAGRQRMLSQRITKYALLLQPDQTKEKRAEIRSYLETSVNRWKVSQDGLLNGDDSLNLPGKNSDKIRAMFVKVNPHFESMYASGKSIVTQLYSDPLKDYATLRPEIDNIIAHESSFLEGMDGIVFQYDDEAHEKVSTLSRLEYLLIVTSLIVIFLEIIFVFRPTTLQVNKTIDQLISSEQNAKQLTKEIGALYGSLEKSYEQLSQVNQPSENPKIYAKTDRGGNVIFIAELFSELSGVHTISSMMRLCDLFKDSGLGDDWMDEIVERISEGKSWQGEISFRGKDNVGKAVDIMVTPVYGEGDEINELIVMGSDITRQKQAEKTMKQKNRAEIEKKINQQKFRSVLILEGQEEERKRIAMDIHDGIGQMLTSLKYQIESIEQNGNEKFNRKIAEINQGIKDVIKEVRRVTFNLKPTVLGDYGLQAALNVFIQEIGKLTNIQLAFRTQGDMTYRLPQKVENNIFRIVQEAINNAIKYSNAEKIEVLLRQTESDLVITVNDEGDGFDEKIIEARDINIESGRGFFNMYERTEYINGTLEIKSAPGQGTVVHLSVPLKSASGVDA